MDTEIILPNLRQDLVYQEYEEGGEKYFVLVDPHEYVLQPVALPIQMMPILKFLDKKINPFQYHDEINKFVGEDVELEPILNLVYYLDQMGFMESENYNHIKSEIDEYKASPVRYPVCAGSSYSDKLDELRQEISEILNVNSETILNKKATSIIVPHLDFRIGADVHKVYSSAYKSISETDADLFVILGTAHFGNSDRFMFTKKNFITPFGEVETDKELISIMESDCQIKIDDMSHKYEHSIELQIVLLQDVFRNKKFKVLPILIGSFYDYLADKKRPLDDKKYVDFIDKLNKAIHTLGRKPIFIASADFAHIGRKFSDEFDAEGELIKLKYEDEELIKCLTNCDAEGFYDLIANKNDSRKICGFSPIYTLLQLTKPSTGKFLGYYQWNEIETKSAVSIAGFAFNKNNIID